MFYSFPSLSRISPFINVTCHNSFFFLLLFCGVTFLPIIDMSVSFQCSDKLGLSLELGSFAAGVMISTTDLAPHTLEQASLSAYFIRSCFFRYFFFTSLWKLLQLNPNLWFILVEIYAEQETQCSYLLQYGVIDIPLKL